MSFLRLRSRSSGVR